jgi:hypothetical protein
MSGRSSRSAKKREARERTEQQYRELDEKLAKSMPRRPL